MEWAMSASLLDNLKIHDNPWLSPKTWESLPSESGLHARSSSSSQSSSSNQTLSTLSEQSLVRLATNALLGIQSSLITIQNLSPIFSSHPPNTTFLHLWNRASTTLSLSNILQSIASTGSLVFLLRHFVDYFTNTLNQHPSLPPYTLVNQAFVVAVGKVLEGYISGLDTIHASVIFWTRYSTHICASLLDNLKILAVSFFIYINII